METLKMSAGEVSRLQLIVSFNYLQFITKHYWVGSIEVLKLIKL